jgi:hypothetical protein
MYILIKRQIINLLNSIFNPNRPRFNKFDANLQFKLIKHHEHIHKKIY